MRAMRDAVTAVTVQMADCSVYGVHRMWKGLQLAGEDIGLDQVARTMRGLEITGAHWSGKLFTIRPDDKASRPPDLVDRKFVDDVPNRLWVINLTYLPT